MPKYAIVDSENNVTNICEWDNESEWSPPEGTTLIQCDEEPDAERGGTYIDGVFARTAVESPVAEPSPAEQIAEMQAALAALMAKVNQSE